MSKIKQVKLYRVRMGSAGQLPKVFPEGMVTGLTKIEHDSLVKNTLLKDCFEPVEVVAEFTSEPLPPEPG